jgi:ABC-type multidrug transport system fused ATPase/permease subunit
VIEGFYFFCATLNHSSIELEVQLFDQLLGHVQGPLHHPLQVLGRAGRDIGAVGGEYLQNVRPAIQAVTSFALVRILGIAAQRAITELRREVQAHVLRLPVRQFDATQSGVLLARIMNDAEGIRNLVGTGLVQLVGGLVTAAIAMVVLFWINWQLTAGMLVVLAAFGGGMAYAFTRLRPIFRERSKLMAQVSGRLTETLGGIRIVKSYVAERREELVFTKGIHALFRNVATTMTGVGGVTALSTVVVGVSRRPDEAPWALVGASRREAAALRSEAA